MSVRAAVAHDQLHHEGGSLLLVDGSVHRVSALRVTIRRHAAVATLVELAEELIRRAVEALVAAGLLEVVEP